MQLLPLVKSYLLFLGLHFQLSPTLSCYECFVDYQDSARLCKGYTVMEGFGIRLDPDICFNRLKIIFNNNNKVIEAGRVGGGYEKDLKKIMLAQILPLVEFFKDYKPGYMTLSETLYEEKLQEAAHNFITAASKLPRATKCIPPCGFQIEGEQYNCITCTYDSCNLPLDCPVETINVMEDSQSEMRCIETFQVAGDIEVIWRFAEEVKTQQVNQFKEVTVGDDRFYYITSTHLHQQGTYQCEVFLDNRSIVRHYYYLSVTPKAIGGRSKLQELFDRSVLPGGGFFLQTDPVLSHMNVLTLLLAISMALTLLLFLLSLGAAWVSIRN